MFHHISSRFLWTAVGAGLCAHVAQAQQPAALLEGHTNVVSSVTFSSDGKQLISGSWDKTVRIWEVESAEIVTTLSGHRDWVLAVVIAADGKRIASATAQDVRLWDATTFEQVGHYPGLGGATVNAVAFSADGRLLATGGRDGTVRLWRIGGDHPQPNPPPQGEGQGGRPARPEVVFRGFDSWVNCVAFACDNKTLAAGTRTGQIRLFDLTSRKEKATAAGHEDQQVMTLAVNPANDTLASGGYDQTVRLWDLATGTQTATLSGHKGIVTAIAWSPDGKLLATGERHGFIKLWDTAAGNRLIATLPGHSDDHLGFSVTALAFSPPTAASGAPHLLASGSYDATVKLWTLPTE